MDRERTGKIGFQGARGANSEIAIRDMFANMEAVPLDTFEDVFNAISSDAVDLAMFDFLHNLKNLVRLFLYFL